MGIKERKIREYRKRRNLILATAQLLFNEYGIEKVTLLDIAEKIEFSKGTIYSHFSSKEEIYAEILLGHLNELLEKLKSVSHQSRGTIDGIRSSLKTYTRFYREHRQYFKLLFFFDLMSNHYRIPGKLLKEIKNRKLACLVQLQNIIRMDFDESTPSREISFVLWGMVNGIIHLIESNQLRSVDLDRLTGIGFDIVTNGIQNIRKNRNEV